MKLRALLDTSVLIALLDANHVHHRLCSQWLSTHTAGWASCPITLNGCVRILSQAAYPNRLPMQTVVAGLQHALHGSGVRSGFMHLPLLPAQAARLAGQPSMALDQMLAGVRLALELAWPMMADRRESAGTIS